MAIPAAAFVAGGLLVMLTGTLVAVVRPPLRNARQRWGTALFLVGVVGIASHLFLELWRGPGDPLGFVLGATGAYLRVLGGIAGCWPARRRWRVAVPALLWVVGWIAVGPTVTAGQGAFYYEFGLLAGVAVGLLGVGMVGLDGAGVGRGSSVVEWKWGRMVAVAGGAFAVPSLVGFVAGEEVLFLSFVVGVVVLAVLLYLVRLS